MLLTEATHTESLNDPSASSICIDTLPQYRYLDVWLESNLNLKAHINKLTVKLGTIIGFLNNCFMCVGL